MSEILLEAKEIRVSRGHRRVLDGVSISLATHARVAVVGANGSGKSTLLRALLGLDAITGGEVLLGGTNVRSLSRVEVARRATLVLQDTHVEVPITVRDLVELGRFAHRGTAQAAHDRARIEEFDVIAARQLFVDGLALLRMATQLGLSTQDEYRGCPSLARQVTREPLPRAKKSVPPRAKA